MLDSKTLVSTTLYSDYVKDQDTERRFLEAHELDVLHKKVIQLKVEMLMWTPTQIFLV